jgi:hypothetical protein
MDRATIAMVYGHTSWAGMDRLKFAQFAEKRKVYRQNFGDADNSEFNPVSFFVLGKGDEKLPLPQLADLVSTTCMVLVLSSEALTIGMLSLLRQVDEIRKLICRDDGINEIAVVIEMGKNVSGESRYSWRQFTNLNKLVDTLQEIQNTKDYLIYLKDRIGWLDKPGGAVRLANALSRKKMNLIFKGTGDGYTITAIKARIPNVKSYYPLGDPEPPVDIPDIRELIQHAITELEKADNTTTRGL